MEKFDIANLCIKNIRCAQHDCDKQHPRCFAGLCIEGKQKDEETGQCDNKDCKLYHFDSGKYEAAIEAGTLIGIYKHNICKIKNCQQQANCRFLHPKWVDQYCLEYLLTNKCKNNCNNHKKWVDVKKEVQKAYTSQDLLPETLCEKEMCQCDKHLNNTQNTCIDYFKGICPNLLCNKSHKFWEDFITDRSNMKDEPDLKPCITVNSQIQQKSIIGDQGTQFQIDQLELKRLQRAISSQNIIDIIFIMDCTKSMDQWIEISHKQISNIIESFKKKITGSSIRIAFIAYRDFKYDQNQKVIDKNHVIFHDFTEDVEDIKIFIGKQKAFGGGDEAEDVYGGIKKATELNLSKHPDSLLITFLFAQSPTHGKQYHDIDDDNLMEDIPDGQLETLIQRYRKLKQNNFFICVRINKKCDKMYQIMKEQFPELSISENINPEDFSSLVTFNLKNSVTRKTKTNVALTVEIEAQSIKTKFMNYSANTNEQKKQFWKTFEQNLQNYIRVNETLLKINLVQENISKEEDGQISKIFKLFDIRNNQNLVIKIPSDIIDEFNQNQTVSKENQEKYEQFCRTKFLSQALAKQMAQVYRQKSSNIKGAPPIFFVSPMIYQLNKPFYGLNALYAETYINLPNITWMKYSNNQQFIETDHYFYSAFSHFSYKESEKQLIITDLQEKDETNLKKEGIGQFLFAQHEQCSIICKELKLIDDQDNNNQIFRQEIWELNETSELPVICETCDEYLQITLQEYKNGLHQKCQQCKDLEQIMESIQCQCCYNLFQSPKNLNQRLGTLIQKCNDCKKSCMEVKERCIYCNIKCQLKLKQQKIQGTNQMICINGKKFLNSLKCKKCNQFYQFEKKLSNIEYKQGNYICDKCNI